MSSGGQIAGAVVGAVVGAYFGGPVGALQGAALGSGIGLALDPPKGPTVQGPRLSDLSVQSSTYGAPIPRVYATVGIHGNLMWLENNSLKETVRKEKVGGKGGGSSQTVKNYEYSATFALGLCQGPITGVRRIWCGDKLLFDAGSNDLDTIIASSKNASGWRLYLGTDDQLPDPRYEANVGVGNAPAYRGMAYIVFYDFALADFSNTLQVAQFKVEVVRAADESSELIQSVSVTNDFNNVIPGTAYSFLESDNEIRIAQPTWNNTYPPSKNVLEYSLRPSSTLEDYRLIASTGVISASPSDNKYVHVSSTFPSVRLSVYPDSYSFLIGYIAVSSFVATEDWVIVNGSQSPLGNGMFRFERDAFAFGTSVASPIYISIVRYNSAIYCFRSGFFDVYDEELNLIDTFATTLSAAGGGNKFLSVDNGVMYLSNYNQVQRLSDDLTTVVRTYSFPGSLSAGNSQVVKNGLYMRASYSDSGGFITHSAQYYALDVMSTLRYPLAEIIEEEVGNSKLLDATDVDVSLVSDLVQGFRISGGSIRSALEPLQAAYPFDVIQSGYKIKVVPRGQASVKSISWYDLCADGENGVLKKSREMDTQLPVYTNVKYLDSKREYALSEQYSERLSTDAVNRVDRELPIVLSADEAAGVAEVLNFLPWIERVEYASSLPPIYSDLEPADVITLTEKDGAIQELRITSANTGQDGKISFTARNSRASLYDSGASGGDPSVPGGTIPLTSASLFVPMDIPMVDESVQNETGFVAAMTGYTDGWPGGIAIRSIDGGQTWVDIQAFVGKCSIGIARDSLAENGCTVIDYSQLQVQMVSGTLSGITRDQMLAGSNYAAYGRDGRWEIVRFQSAVVQADGSYVVSGFVRGQKGTEWATGLHQLGDYFILLSDPDNAFIGMAVDSIGTDANYRGVTAGASYAGAANVPFAYQGVNLECLSPVYAFGERDGSENLSVTFTRRSRFSSNWWVAGVQAAVGEASEAYEIDVLDGSTVVRTIAATTPAFTYTAADQVTDFGSAQSSITLRIYQLSAVVGRGYPLEVTL